MIGNLLSRVMLLMADPRKRTLILLVAVGLALAASSFIPAHHALADGVLIPGGQGV